jgi:hypothetical protein
MGDAVGLDLGLATSAAARLRGDDVEPAVLVPTADLGVGAATTRHCLESLAARAVGPDTSPAVGVAIPSRDHEAQAEVEAAAREAFADPLLVLRPAATAAWFRYTNYVHPDAVLVMVEADETQVAVTLVRPGPRIPTIERPTVGEPLSSSAPVLDAIDTVAATLTAAGLIPTERDVAVIVGGARWLAELAEGITAAMDLAAFVDPEPWAAAAYGAALLALQSDGFGVGTALALGAPAAGAGLGAVVPAAGPSLGSGVGGAVGATGGAGTGLGEAVGATGAGTGPGAALRDMGYAKDDPTDPFGESLGEAVGDAKAPPSPPDGEGGGSPKPPPSRLPAGGLKRGLVLAAPVAVVLVLGGLAVRSCVQDPDTTTLATASEPADPDDPSTTGTTGTDGASPGGSDKPDPLAPTSSESITSTTRPTTITTRPTPTTPAASTPVVPPTDPPPPGDTTRPSVGGFLSSEPQIGADVACELPMTTVLSAAITDDTGVAGATITWSAMGGYGGSLTMAPGSGNTWSATLGPILDKNLTVNDILPITWSVMAVDAAGNQTGSVQATGGGTVSLKGCFFPNPG